MSINFEHPVNDAARRLIEQVTGGNAPSDDRTFLVDMIKLDSGTMRQIARAAAQPVTVELAPPGAVKTLADGSKYVATKRGWVKQVSVAHIKAPADS